MPGTESANRVCSPVARRYLAFHLTDDIGPIRLRNLVRHFGTLDAVRSASRAELERVDRIGPKVSSAIRRGGVDDEVEREIERAAAAGAVILCAEDDAYPEPLKQMPDPPVCLYVRGTPEPTDAVAVAVVGTRRCSNYGREQALRFGELLATAGFTVVSGMARGIDGYAHRGALHAGGRTLAVLGCGLGHIYPREHEELSGAIIEHGALFSEYPMDVGPEPRNFPRRNRLIAALSLGVIVVEASNRSGALITARQALDYNREVFAVPGRVDRPDLSAGAHALIRDGLAKLTTCLDDVLDELGEVGELLRQPESSRAAQPGSESLPSNADHHHLTETELAVLTAIRNDARSTEQIGDATQLDTGTIFATTTRLQLRGCVKQLPGGYFECTQRSSRKPTEAR